MEFEMKFIVICQYALFSTSLCNLVKQYRDGIDVIENSTVDAAIDVIDKPKPATLIIFYMQLTEAGWIDLETLHNKAPEIPILVIADFETNEQIRKAIFIGANGCVSTNFTWRTVTFVIQRILDGEIVSPPLNFNIEKAAEPISPAPREPTSPQNSNSDSDIPVVRLTPRQQDVLKLIQTGNSNKEIARKLEMAVPTVKIHCAAIYRELGVKNRTQAAIDAEKYL
jgi:DNA-binding NarL/FixJ family response regulator